MQFVITPREDGPYRGISVSNHRGTSVNPRMIEADRYEVEAVSGYILVRFYVGDQLTTTLFDMPSEINVLNVEA